MICITRTGLLCVRSVSGCARTGVCVVVSACGTVIRMTVAMISSGDDQFWCTAREQFVRKPS